ncbi:conserved hypothetical protein [Klebsiella quasipneumoniae subsp. similipneumoniae]|nr:conserved hypothetical protein [Klebsiella quasipneumoniae subsp. similipneumoniae]
MQAGFHSSMDPCLMAGLEQRPRQARIHKGFAAGKGDAAATAIVKGFIAQHRRHDLLDALLFAAHRERGGGAAVAQRGDMAVVNVLPVNDQAIEGAGDNRRRRLLAQLAAGKAQARVIQQVFAAGAALRILAPAAAQRAAFQEDDGADPWAVMGGIALDIEDHGLPSSLRMNIKTLSNESYIDANQQAGWR